MKTQALLLFASLVLISIYACQEEEPKPLPDTTYFSADDQAVIDEYLNMPLETIDYTIDFPAYYGNPSSTVNNDMATLGRVIFYDKNLSKDRSISCASCHKQELAFADDVAFSRGIENHHTDRNSLALGAVFSFSEYYGQESLGRIPFMWDNRASSVPEQSEMSFANSREMGMDMKEVIDRMAEQPYYHALIKKAYGFEILNEGVVLAALESFVNSMSSHSSKFDEEMDKHFESTISTSVDVEKEFSGFTASENLGKRIFLESCSHCHGRIVSPPARTSSNNGLDLTYTDQGVGSITQDEPDMGKFKVPPLRNVAITAPYMHDGRFATLEEVIDHYSFGVQHHPNLGYELKTDDGIPNRPHYDPTTRKALLDFLHTLTDEVFTTDDRFSDPFKK